jgi:hypothetical protein
MVVVTPGAELPAGRWTMDWPTIKRTIELGRRDMRAAIERSRATADTVVVGTAAERLAATLNP